MNKFWPEYEHLRSAPAINTAIGALVILNIIVWGICSVAFVFVRIIHLS